MRLILLAIGAVIILAILWDGQRRKKLQQRKISDLSPETESDFEASGGEALDAEVHREPYVLDDEEPAEILLEEELVDVVPEPIVEPPPAAPIPEPEPPVRVEAEAPTKPIYENTATGSVPELVWFTIKADEETPFGGFSLLQALLANGFRFADDKLFYYHENREAAGQKLFGLAAATEEGVFDLSNMARFTCKGLVLFISPKEHPDLKLAFNEMLDVAESLAEDLDAQLFIEKNTPWLPESIDRLRSTLKL